MAGTSTEAGVKGMQFLLTPKGGGSLAPLYPGLCGKVKIINGDAASTRFKKKNKKKYPHRETPISSTENFGQKKPFLGWRGIHTLPPAAVCVSSRIFDSNTIVIYRLGGHNQTMNQTKFCVILAICILFACVPVSGTSSNIAGKAVAAGYQHTVALTDDGKVVAWGGNLFGQCNVPSDLPQVKAVAAGGWHTVALTNDGKVVAWGEFPRSTPPCLLARKPTL